jgi:hypothetical protein
MQPRKRRTLAGLEIRGAQSLVEAAHGERDFIPIQAVDV